MRLYDGYVLVHDLKLAYGKPFPKYVKQDIVRKDIKFGNMVCAKISDLYGDIRKAAESCRKLDNLYPPTALSIELGFYPEYFRMIIEGRIGNIKVKYKEISSRQNAVVLPKHFLALLQKGFIPYRFEKDFYYMHVIDFYGAKIGFYHPDLVDDISDSNYLPKPYSIDSHSTGIRGMVIYHSNRKIGRSVGFQSLWTENGKEKSKAFSIQKYGFKEAFRLALNERCKRIGIGGIASNCRLDFGMAEARLKRMGLESYIGMQPATQEESRKRRSENIRVNNNTGVDGVMLTAKKEKGVLYLMFRARCLIDGKELSVSFSVKKLGFLNAAREAILWRMRRTGRGESFSENQLCKKRLSEWIKKNDEVYFAAIELNDEWINSILTHGERANQSQIKEFHNANI